ncbi:hypothetical protein CEXT_317591 [Caerostris extrusa]|uniref:Uncharacterized protein n=1 Tax=Caerostris extrusa TaxID=172846 RepID=A0AAV4QZW8_CAEEX|nr:hypothetical protein CEXT_317591 [Caerostris extrusa]
MESDSASSPVSVSWESPSRLGWPYQELKLQMELAYVENFNFALARNYREGRGICIRGKINTAGKRGCSFRGVNALQIKTAGAYHAPIPELWGSKYFSPLSNTSCGDSFQQFPLLPLLMVEKEAFFFFSSFKDWKMVLVNSLTAPLDFV